MVFLNFPSPDKRGGESWGWGPDVIVDATAITAIVPKTHSYHSLRQKQDYAEIHLSCGLMVEVMVSAANVYAEVAKHLTDA
jgi:hypothetical protein